MLSQDVSDLEGRDYYIDTHAHLDMIKEKTPQEAVQEAERERVRIILNIGAHLEASHQAVEMAQSFPNVFATVGVHPHDARFLTRKAIEEMRKLCKSPKVVAVGETGLDYFRNLSTPEEQRQAFIWQIELARELELPLVVHDRDAHKDIKEILKSEEVKRGVLHCFSADETMIDFCLEQGLHISITGNITFKNAQRLWEMVKKIPLDILMLETDCPFLAPHPFRGQENYPKYIPLIARAVAEAKGVSENEVMRKTTENALRLFDFDAE